MAAAAGGDKWANCEMVKGRRVAGGLRSAACSICSRLHVILRAFELEEFGIDASKSAAFKEVEHVAGILAIQAEQPVIHGGRAHQNVIAAYPLDEADAADFGAGNTDEVTRS
jgi:hypothetical protein